MDLLHGHRGGDDSHRIDKSALDDIPQLIRRSSAIAKGPCGERDLLAGRYDTHEKLGDHIDSHLVLGDQRTLADAANVHRNGVHVHERDVVNDRNDQGAAADHDLFAARTGAYECLVLGRVAVEPMQQINADRDQDRQQDDDGNCVGPGHLHILRELQPHRTMVKELMVGTAPPGDGQHCQRQRYEIDEIGDGIERDDWGHVTDPDHDVDEREDRIDCPSYGHDEPDPEVADPHRPIGSLDDIAHPPEIHLAKNVEPEGDGQQNAECGIEHAGFAEVAGIAP